MAVRIPHSRLSLGGAIGLMAGLVLAGSSCGDPVRDEAIALLGPEDPKIPVGESHRPGQPCLLCHSDEGDAEPFSLAGTVYMDAVSNSPVGHVDVKVVDSKGRSFVSTTNCAGNFFVRPSDFAPAYPYWISMDKGMVHRSMETPSFREGSCAACHFDPKGKGSAGHVYLLDDEMPPPNQCN